MTRADAKDRAERRVETERRDRDAAGPSATPRPARLWGRRDDPARIDDDEDQEHDGEDRDRDFRLMRVAALQRKTTSRRRGRPAAA